MNELEVFKALSNKTRLEILQWLKAPERHFPEQINGFKLGISVGQIQRKSGLTQSTVSEFLIILQRAGLVKSVRKGQATYYSRKEEAFVTLTRFIQAEL